MVKVHFIQANTSGDAGRRSIEGKPGQSVMQAAVAAGIEGIAADCGGLLTCATCHVYVQPAWMDKLPAPDDDEQGMLEFTAAPRRETSRLSCQIVLAPELEGLELELPDRQY